MDIFIIENITIDNFPEIERKLASSDEGNDLKQ